MDKAAVLNIFRLTMDCMTTCTVCERVACSDKLTENYHHHRPCRFPQLHGTFQRLSAYGFIFWPTLLFWFTLTTMICQCCEYI